MIDLFLNVEVRCSNGPAGRSTHVIGNPINREITHLVVKSYLPPFHEYLVPVDQVEETANNQIKLKCTRDALNKMQPFEVEEYRQAEMPGYLCWTNAVPAVVVMTDEVETHVLVKRQNVPAVEIALQRGARVEATDGYVGQVDDLLIDSNSVQVTHLVLQEKHIFQKREITIPVSQIDHINENTIYLKLDRQSIEELPTTPIQRWTRSVSKGSA